MKTYKVWIELILLFLLAIFTLANILPDTIVMPSTVQMILLFSVLFLLGLFLVLFWQENPYDERDFLHQSMAGKYAYTTGCCTLLIGILYQGIKHDIDPFLIITLFFMVTTKILVQRWMSNQ